MKKMVILGLLLIIFALMTIQTAAEAGYVSEWVNMAITYGGGGTPVWVDLPIWINHDVMCI